MSINKKCIARDGACIKPRRCGVLRSCPQPQPLFDQARMPAPDDMGFFMHPDVPDCDEEQSIVPLLAAIGYEAGFRAMESDAEDLDELRVFQDDETAPARWTPTPPAGDGWLLVGKFDMEEGAHALFVRLSEESAHG